VAAFLLQCHLLNCGLALLIVGILIHLKVKEVSEILQENVTFPTLGLIIIGAIIFTIAFFGCCGAIRESHCMIVTFAVLLLTILVIQVAVGIFAFIKLKDMGTPTIREPYTKTFASYYNKTEDKDLIDAVQSNLKCCGIDRPSDFTNLFPTKPIPWSCCDHENADDKTSCSSSISYASGCVSTLNQLFKDSGKVLGGIAIGIAAVEFVGIVFALCLANSIRNAERRGYRV